MGSEELEIVLITYNRVNYLKSTLEELLSEESPVKNVSITVLDNLSNDGTSEYLDAIGQSHPNLKHIVNNVNIGGNGNIARAFEVATKEYIWVLCDDDSYSWRDWDNIKKAMDEGYDAIMTRRTKSCHSDFFYQSTFVPACIYKRENITSTVISNAIDNTQNLFPQLAMAAQIINENKKIRYTRRNTVIMGLANYTPLTYMRGIKEHVPSDRKFIFWTPGYLNSVQLLRDRKKQIEIIDGLRHGHKTLYKLFRTKTFVNSMYYGNSSHNTYLMRKHLSFKQRLLFDFAYIKTALCLPLFNKRFLKLFGKERYIEYFKYTNEQKIIDSLAKKFKGKKVLIYGAGMMSKVLFDNYDLSKLNIVAVTDTKYEENSTFHGFPAIHPKDAKKYEFDVVIFAIYMTFVGEKTLKRNYSKYNKLKRASFIKRIPFVPV